MTATPTSSTAAAHLRDAALPAVDPSAIDLAAIRARFPALAGDTVLLENAGGSQVPGEVADAVRRHLLEDYAQLGAGYPASDRATATVAAAHDWVETFMNAGDRGRVILGASCTQLLTMLADAHARALAPGEEIVVFDGGHESNVGPWRRLADRGLVVRTWPCDPETGRARLADLEPLLNERTRLVATVHVSNLLGAIEDVRAVADAVHAVGARLCVDGVAYAPHRAIDVQALGADWYVYSTYKVYGPHMAAVFGTHEAIAALDGPNHFFVPRDDVPYVWEPGGVSHEGCAGLLALRGHLRALAGMTGAPVPERDEDADRDVVERAFAVMTACEAPLQARLLEWLAAHPRIIVVGPAPADPAERVSTIAFRHAERSSAEIAAAVNARGFGIRHGHMYSLRLCEALGIPPADGVVRVSAVHYNAPAEIEALVGALEEIC